MKIHTFISYVMEGRHYNHVLYLPREIDSVEDISTIEGWLEHNLHSRKNCFITLLNWKVLKQEPVDIDPSWDSIL